MSAPNQLYTDQLPGRTLVLNREEYLYFSGTSYLGIPLNESFREHLLAGMLRYGTNYSSSRNSNLRLDIFRKAETFLASLMEAEAALTMSSGYMAGQIVVQTLRSSGHFMYAPGTHPALWRTEADGAGARMEYQEWVNLVLQKVSDTATGQNIIIVCNSLDPLYARNHSFSWVSSLPNDKQITMLVDDSHGFGITGEEGAGCYRFLKKSAPAVRVLVLGSLGKALGIPAGVILGDKQIIAELRTSPYFGGASPAIPAYLYACMRSKKVFAQAREKLFYNIKYFKQLLLEPRQFQSFDNYPIFYTADEGLYHFLWEHKVIVSSFRYPTPADEPITRVVLNSMHTTEDLRQLSNLINQHKVVSNRG